MELLQINAGDPALHDDVVARRIIEETSLSQFPVDRFSGVLKQEAVEHFQNAIRLIHSVAYVFDTMEDHYEVLQGLAPGEDLIPNPPDTVARKRRRELRPDLFSQEVRSKLRYYSNEKLVNVENLDVYGNLVDMSMVYNEMVGVYEKTRDKMYEMSGRIPGPRDRYTTLQEDLRRLFFHLTRLAPHLEGFLQHYPDHLLEQAIPDSRYKEVTKKRVERLLKAFQVFVPLPISEEGEDVDVGGLGEAKSYEEKEEKGVVGNGRDGEDKEKKGVKLVPQKTLSLVKAKYVEFIEHPNTSEEDKEKVTPALQQWDEALNGRAAKNITDQDNIPILQTAGGLRIWRSNLKLFNRKYGINVDLALEQVENALGSPTVSQEYGGRVIRTALQNAFVRKAAEAEGRTELARELERITKAMEKALAERNDDLYESLERESKKIQADLKILIERTGGPVDEKVIRQLVTSSFIQLERSTIKIKQLALLGAASLGTISFFLLLKRRRGKKRKKSDL